MKKRYQIDQQRAVQQFRRLATEENPHIQMILPMADIVGMLQDGVGHPSVTETQRSAASASNQGYFDIANRNLSASGGPDRLALSREYMRSLPTHLPTQ